MFLILTAAEADQVRGETVPGHTIEPHLLKDGTYALTTVVCADPHHASKHAFLSALPLRDVPPDEFELLEE